MSCQHEWNLQPQKYSYSLEPKCKLCGARQIVALEEQMARYYVRMKRNESNLAYIREKLGVTNRPNEVTLQRIEDLQDMARSWVLYTDALNNEKERTERMK